MMLIHFVNIAALLSCLSLELNAQSAGSIGAPPGRVLAGNAWHAVADDNDQGLYLVAWSERGREGARIRAALLSAGQRDRITYVDMEHVPDGYEDVRPAVAWLNTDTAAIAWQRSGAGEKQVLMRLVTRDASLPSQTVRLSDSDASSMTPMLRRSANGDVLAVFQDFRNGNLDVYARRIDTQGRPVDAAVRVNDDAGNALQGSPRLSSDSRYNFVILWSDNRNDGKWKLYYQLWDGGLKGANVLLDSAQRKAMTIVASAVYVSEDTVMFAWKDYREGHSNIYRRIGDIRNASLTPAERVNDDDGEQWQRLPVMDGDGAGNIVMCWEDYRNTHSNQRGDIYMQIFNRDGTVRGDNQRVNDGEHRVSRENPIIAMGRDGTYLILWHQASEGVFHLFGQWFRLPDERLGSNFCLSCELHNTR